MGCNTSCNMRTSRVRRTNPNIFRIPIVILRGQDSKFHLLTKESIVYLCTMLKVQAVVIIPDINYDICLGGNKSKSMKKREVERGSNSPKNMYVCVGDCM